jgi:RNA polymerase sigma-70 factor (ECF subfamily)
MSFSEHPDELPRRGGFMATRWTLVMRARRDSPTAQAALEELCEAYYEPVHAFIRRYDGDGEAARDLTQEFFARLLAGRGLGAVEPGRGRFRSYLLGAIKHFIANERDRARSSKRGGGLAVLSSPPANADGDTGLESQIPDPAGPPSDAVFDRQWGLTIVSRATARLAAEFAEASRAEHFDVLKPWLLGDCEFLSQPDAARQLGITEGAVKVAVHRLRKRFRELVRAEIAPTVDAPGQIHDELRYLLEVLSRQ